MRGNDQHQGYAPRCAVAAPPHRARTLTSRGYAPEWGVAPGSSTLIGRAQPFRTSGGGAANTVSKLRVTLVHDTSGI